MRWTVLSCKCPKSKSSMTARAGVFAAGLIAGLAGPVSSEVIVGAQFGGETDRYGHGILGDAIEFSELVIETEDWSNRVRYRVTLPVDHVFEDIAPRLWDITGDGDPEIVVIETDVRLGGSLAVYDQTGKIAETPHIGRTKLPLWTGLIWQRCCACLNGTAQNWCWIPKSVG